MDKTSVRVICYVSDVKYVNGTAWSADISKEIAADNQCVGHESFENTLRSRFVCGIRGQRQNAGIRFS